MQTITKIASYDIALEFFLFLTRDFTSEKVSLLVIILYIGVVYI